MQIQILDGSGHVSDLKAYESSSKQTALKLEYHVRFAFDPQGRVVMQETDPYTFEAGDDYEPLPGKLIVRYNANAHTREQSFYEPDGRLDFRNLAVLDHDGNVCALQVFDSAGKERQETELFHSLMARDRTPEQRPGKRNWEVDYDDHGNWTERRLYFVPAGGGDKVLMDSASQTLKYR